MFLFLHCPLSGPDLTYISLLIIPCIIYHVTNKETLTLTLTLHDISDTLLYDISDTLLHDISDTLLYDISDTLLHDISDTLLHDISDTLLHDISDTLLYDIYAPVLKYQLFSLIVEVFK